MTKETGGSAFPVTGQRNEFSGEIEVYADAGMNLRDWFAGQALQGELSCQRSDYEWNDAKKLAELSYKIADAMIEARKS